MIGYQSTERSKKKKKAMSEKDSPINLDQEPPNNAEAERAVLAALMLGAQSFSDVHHLLTPKDFFHDRHEVLFGIMLEMIQEDIPVEMTSVMQRVHDLNKFKEIGGVNYLSNLYNQTGSAYNVDYYASVVREHSIRRKLMKRLTEVLKKANTKSEDIQSVLEFAEHAIFELSQSDSQKDWQVISKVVDAEFKRIQELMKMDSEITGMDTGFADLNKMLAGLQKTDLFILAARPAMGKTAFALNIALNIAEKGDGVALFSLEMSAGQLVTRLICMKGLIPADSVRKGTLSKEYDFPKLIEACESLHSLPIFIDDTPSISISKLSSKARRLKANNPNISLIVVDYIGLMQGDKANVSRQEQIAEASRGLKGLAKELDVCVMALSQLNRGVEQRTDKRPVPSDLRESGAIEQDADIISFIYRDEYYNEDTPERGVAEIIIAKQRNGPTGTVKLHFEGKHTRFYSRSNANIDGYGGDQYM